MALKTFAQLGIKSNHTHSLGGLLRLIRLGGLVVHIITGHFLGGRFFLGGALLLPFRGSGRGGLRDGSRRGGLLRLTGSGFSVCGGTLRRRRGLALFRGAGHSGWLVNIVLATNDFRPQHRGGNRLTDML